eukprot:14011_1
MSDTFVLTLTGQNSMHCAITVTRNTTIRRCKELFRSVINSAIALDDIKFRYGGKSVSRDNLTLEDYGIRDNIMAVFVQVPQSAYDKWKKQNERQSRQRRIEEERQRKIEEETQRKMQEEKQKKLEAEKRMKMEEEKQKQLQEAKRKKLESEKRQKEIEQKLEEEKKKMEEMKQVQQQQKQLTHDVNNISLNIRDGLDHFSTTCCTVDTDTVKDIIAKNNESLQETNAIIDELTEEFGNDDDDDEK